MLVEWLSLALLNFSGQVVQKGQGRSLARLARAARALPAFGRSVEARRKIIDRAVRIAQLPPKIKKAAKKARLDNNQRALLKIAKVKGRKAQFAKVEDLAGRSQNASALPKQFGKASATSHDGLQGKTSNTAQSPSLQSGTDDAVEDDKSTARNKTTATPVKRKTSFDDLEAFWNPDGRELWAYAPFSEREQFIEKLRRAKCKARVDVVAFVRDVFRGRQKVEKRALYALAKDKGLAKKTVREVLKLQGYRAKRKGQRSWAVWYFLNQDRNWEGQMRTVSDAKLGAAKATHPDRKMTRPKKWATGKARDDYYSKI